jgi:hypothetical protein
MPNPLNRKDFKKWRYTQNIPGNRPVGFPRLAGGLFLSTAQFLRLSVLSVIFSYENF